MKTPRPIDQSQEASNEPDPAGLSKTDQANPLLSPSDVELRDGRILSDALDEHALWLKSAGRSGRRLCLSDPIRGLNAITGTYLAGADLRLADLSGCDLYKSVLFKADLTGAIMDKASLRGVTIMQSVLARSSIRGADLTSALFADSDCRMTSFRESESFKKTIFYGCRLEEASLRWARIANSDFIECDVTDADFRMADLTASNFERTGGLHYSHLGGAGVNDLCINGAGLSDQHLREMKKRSFSQEFRLSPSGIDAPVNAIAYELSNGGLDIRGRDDLHDEFRSRVFLEVRSFEDLGWLSRSDIEFCLDRWIKMNETGNFHPYERLPGGRDPVPEPPSIDNSDQDIPIKINQEPRP